MSVMRPASAAMLSAGAFAVAHAGLAPGSVLSAFPFGLLFAWLYRHSGSLLPAVASHAVNNVGTLLAVGAQ